MQSQVQVLQRPRAPRRVGPSSATALPANARSTGLCTLPRSIEPVVPRALSLCAAPLRVAHDARIRGCPGHQLQSPSLPCRGEQGPPKALAVDFSGWCSRLVVRDSTVISRARSPTPVWDVVGSPSRPPAVCRGWSLGPHCNAQTLRRRPDVLQSETLQITARAADCEIHSHTLSALEALEQRGLGTSCHRISLSATRRAGQSRPRGVVSSAPRRLIDGAVSFALEAAVLKTLLSP